MKKYIFALLALVVGISFFLRFYKVVEIPPGLYIDEASIGLNAYDILKTGHDQYGVSHPLFFAALGEYKMPVYIYLVTGAMMMVGKDELAIRLPSVVFGSLTVLAIFFLTVELCRRTTKNENTRYFLGLIAAIILATSSWQLQFSRAGFEATVALFFYVLALLTLLWYGRTNKIFLLLVADASLLVTFYTYDGYRIIVPITALIALIFFLRKQQKLSVLLLSFCLFVASLPLVLFTLTTGGLMRFSQTSAFNIHEQNSVLQGVINLVIFVKNYLSYFSITYLFRFGDGINRHQVQGFGPLYLWQFPCIVFGLFLLFKTKDRLLRFIILSLLLIAPATAAFTLPSPHTLRFLLGVVPYTILTVLGLYQMTVVFWKRKKMLVTLFISIAVLAFVEFVYYVDYYYIHYPLTALMDWGGQCKQVAQRIQNDHTHYTTIYIDESLLCQHDYFAFYIPTVPVSMTTLTTIPAKKPGDTVLFVKPLNKQTPAGQLLYSVYLPNQNHDVFAQFWKL